MEFAEIYVDQKVDKPLTYRVPLELQNKLTIGARVLVPLRGKIVKGTLLSFVATPLNFTPLLIDAHLSEESLPNDLFDLAKWISTYYMAPLKRVLITLLPSSLRKTMKEELQYYVERGASEEKTQLICSDLQEKNPSQAKVLETLLRYPKGLFLSKLLEESRCSMSPVKTLHKQKIVQLKKVEVDRSLFEDHEYVQSAKKELHQEQKEAFQKLFSTLESRQFHVELLFGVTGSGKTEIYLQTIEAARKKNLGVILLVPEIALTTQTIERLKSRFTERIAILHHRLSDGERFDAYRMIRKGEINIVVGARSAIFSPVQNLGLIIVDEEQDSSYKNEESPCYHARDVAIVRAKLTRATVILGSATPSFETYYNATKQKYGLSLLSKRAGEGLLPEVHIIDMLFEEEKKKGFTLFSDPLLQKIETRLKKGEQILLFLNRRGYFKCQICLNCNEPIKCANCDVSLTYHKGDNQSVCHVCGHTEPPQNAKCPKCHSNESIRYRGPGTEQVEKALHAIFKDIRTLRMDADTTRHKGSHDLLFRSFKSGKADVLIGTQMIAKGLHFPLVTLVGILNADSMLHVPDFRATEFAFQLLTQVSGRAGRSELRGEVILQTKLKDHPLMQWAKTESYIPFFNDEMISRKQFSYPPFTKMIRLVYSSLDEETTLSVANEHFLQLSAYKNHFTSNLVLYPPVPCGVSKIKSKYRYQFLLKGDNSQDLHHLVQILKPKKGVKMVIDVDPLITYS